VDNKRFSGIELCNWCWRIFRRYS